MERVGDLAGVGQRHVEGAPIGAGEVQHAPVDALAPRLGLREQPPGGTRSVATRDKVEQLTPLHVDNRGAPPPGAPPPGAPEQGLIETQRLHRTDPRGVRGEQRFAPGEHRPVRRVPVTTQLGGHIGDRAGVAAHRHSRPASARAVSADRAGAICSSTSVNEATSHVAAGQRHRHLCHMRRTGRPNAGRSTNPTALAPLDHTAPPQPPHAGRARVRMCNANGPPGASSTPRTSTSPRPTSNSQTRVGFSSTGGLLGIGVCQPRFWRPPTPPSRTHCPLISEEPEMRRDTASECWRMRVNFAHPGSFWPLDLLPTMKFTSALNEGASVALMLNGYTVGGAAAWASDGGLRLGRRPHP